MIMRFPPTVKILCRFICLMAPAACGNNGAPAYAPETQQAASTAAETRPASASAGAHAVTAATPSDPHVLYDLREKCGEDARRWYQHFYEDGGVAAQRSMVSHGYNSHYDPKTNNCFALTTSISSIKELKSRNAQIVEVQNLANVLENKNIGTFFYRADSTAPAECRVAETACKSRDEWQSLTAPYMND